MLRESAQHLVLALAKRGWTRDDFRCLLYDDMPEKTREFLRANRPPEMDKLVAEGHMKIEDLFTESVTKELGYTQGVRTRVLKRLRAAGITNLAELLAPGKWEMYRSPGISNSTVRYIEAVLATHHIKLFEI